METSSIKTGKTKREEDIADTIIDSTVVKSIVIGKNNIKNCIIDYTFTKTIKVSKDKEDKEDKNGIDCKINIRFKGNLQGIIDRLASGKPVISQQGIIRRDWNRDVIPREVYNITYGATPSREVLTEDDIEELKAMSQIEQLEFMKKKLNVEF